MRSFIKYIISFIFGFCVVWASVNTNANAYQVTPEYEGNTELNIDFTFYFNNWDTLYDTEYHIETNTSYNHWGLCVYYLRTFDANTDVQEEQWVVANVLDLINGYSDNSEPFCRWEKTYYTVGTHEQYDYQNGVLANDPNLDGGSKILVPTALPWEIDFPVFADRDKAVDYYRYGLLDDESFRYGSEFMNYPVSWDPDNDPSNPNYTPSREIPKPQIQLVKGQNLSQTHKIMFLNNIFDDHNSQSEDGVYGIVCNCTWFTCNDFTFRKNNALAMTYEVYYDSLLKDYNNIYVYGIPQNTSDYNICPRYLDFDTNAKSRENFSMMLQTFPVENRNIGFTNPLDADRLAAFQEMLTFSTCAYNSVVYECFYYKKDPQTGNFIAGPKVTGYFNIPSQGVVWDSYYGVLDPDPGDGGGGQFPDPDPNPGITPRPDPVVPDPIDPGTIPDVDISNLKNSMTGMFSLLGEFPSFIGALFNFIPEWVLMFIAVAITLCILIGTVKLFLG